MTRSLSSSVGRRFRARFAAPAAGEHAPAPAAALAHIVYLLPEGYDPERLIAALRNGARPEGLHEVGSDDASVIASFAGLPRACFARLDVRPQSVTISAETFSLRRDLLVHVMDLVSQHEEEETARPHGRLSS